MEHGNRHVVSSSISLETSYPEIYEKEEQISKRVFGEHTIEVGGYSSGMNGPQQGVYKDVTEWHEVRGERLIGYEEKKKFCTLKLVFDGYHEYENGICTLWVHDTEANLQLVGDIPGILKRGDTYGKYNSFSPDDDQVRPDEYDYICYKPRDLSFYKPKDWSYSVALNFVGKNFNKDLILRYIGEIFIQSCRLKVHNSFSERIKEANNKIVEITSRIGEERWWGR